MSVTKQFHQTPGYNYQYWILIFNNSPKCALPHTSLSSLLKQITHCLTVLTSTVSFLKTFSKHRWVLYFFPTWKNPMKFLLHGKFYVKCYFARLLLSCYLQQGKKNMIIHVMIQFLLPYHQHLLVSAKSQCIKVGGITFSCHRITPCKQNTQECALKNDFLKNYE